MRFRTLLERRLSGEQARHGLQALWKTLRLLSYSPIYWHNWSAALDAAGRHQWSAVGEKISRIHARGYATDDSRFWLGCALVNLQRWEEAVGQFSSIAAPLSRPDWQASRVFNHALALAHIDDVREAIRLLDDSPKGRWPTDLRKSAGDLRESLEARNRVYRGLPSDAE